MASKLHANLSIAINTIGGQKLDVLRKGLASTSQSALSLAKTYDKLAASERRLQRFQKSVGRAGLVSKGFEKVSNVASSMGKGFGSVIDIGSKMFLTGHLIASGFRAVAGAASLALTPIKEFQSAMANVRIKGGFDAAATARLGEQAKQLGRTTMFAPTQAAGAQVALAASGLTEQQIGISTPTVLKFAQAADMGTEEASDYLVNVARQFQMDLADPKTLTRVGDAIIKASNLSTIGPRDLQQTLKYAGPIAFQAGESIEQAAAKAAILGNSGLKGSQSGTGLRNLYTAFAKPKGGKHTAAMLEEIGLTKEDVNEAMTNIPLFLEQLEDRMKSKGWGNSKRIAFAASLFGQYGMTAALVLQKAAGSSADVLVNGIAAMTGAVQDATGEMDRAAAIRGATLEGKLSAVDARFETLRLTIGERLAPYVEKGLNGVIAKLEEWELAAQTDPEFIKSLHTVGSILEKMPVALEAVNTALGVTVELFASIIEGYRIIDELVNQTKLDHGMLLADEETSKTGAVAEMSPKEQAVALQLDPTNKRNPLHPEHDPNWRRGKNLGELYVPAFDMEEEADALRAGKNDNASFPWSEAPGDAPVPEPAVLDIRVTTDAGTTATVTKIKKGAVAPRVSTNAAP